MLTLPLLPSTVSFLDLDQLPLTDEGITVRVSNPHPSATCPVCGQPSARIQSHYERRLADLPCSGVAVRLLLQVRRFFCDNAACQRRIFSEGFPGLVRPYARRTERLQATLQRIGLALGGEGGARLAAQLGMPVSPDTVLRQLHHTPVPAAVTPRVLGVDDWAYRRGYRYGTLLVDLERHRPVELLPDRQAETLADWLKEHPGVEIICRDRGGSYAKGARDGAPNACQVADRWHLLKNLREAVERLLGQHRRDLQQVAEVQAAAAPPPMTLPTPAEPSTPPPPPAPLASAERARQARRQGRLARYQQVTAWHGQGVPIRTIAQRLKMGRNTVRRYLRAEAFPERASRRRKIAPFLPYLKHRWQAGCHVAATLWGELVEQGFKGSLNTVKRAVQPWRQAAADGGNKISWQSPVTAPSPRQVSWWLLGLANESDEETQADHQRFVDALGRRCPALQRARELATDFVHMIRQRQATHFNAWVKAVKSSGLVELIGFVSGLLDDKAAVLAALTLPWSNGQVEGQINRLKCLKRQMYGRASFELLRVRVLQPPWAKARGPPVQQKCGRTIEGPTH